MKILKLVDDKCWRCRGIGCEECASWPPGGVIYERGDQVLYVPNHAEGNTCHADCERGFVTSASDDGAHVFCRFIRNGGYELRTRANSERCYSQNLTPCLWVSQNEITALLKYCDSLAG